MKKKSYADMDPLEEIRAIREEISGEFNSLRDLGAYLRDKRSGDSTPAVTSGAPKAAMKRIGQRKAVRRLAHA